MCCLNTPRQKKQREKNKYVRSRCHSLFFLSGRNSRRTALLIPNRRGTALPLPALFFNVTTLEDHNRKQVNMDDLIYIEKLSDFWQFTSSSGTITVFTCATMTVMSSILPPALQNLCTVSVLIYYVEQKAWHLVKSLCMPISLAPSSFFHQGTSKPCKATQMRHAVLSWEMQNDNKNSEDYHQLRL
jgi:hypothetical protein